MKYLILVLFLVSFLNAAPYITEQHVIDWHGKVVKDYTSYGTYQECNLIEGVTCYNLEGKDIDTHVVSIDKMFLIEDADLKAAKELLDAATTLEALEDGKAKRVLDLILIRVAADEVINHPLATQNLKDRATAFKQAANTELSELLNL